MLATGIINPENRTFDILGVQETNTSISTINGQLKLSWHAPNGELIQIVKQIDTDESIAIGDALDVSPTLEQSLGGYAQRTTNDGRANALTAVDWTNTQNLVTKTFTDDNGINRTAVLLPVTL